MNTQTDFRSIAGGLAELLERKNEAYGDTFASLFEEYGMTYSIIHLQEKLNRLKSLTESGCSDNGEKVQDSLLDLAGYCILTLRSLGGVEEMPRASFADGVTFSTGLPCVFTVGDRVCLRSDARARVWRVAKVDKSYVRLEDGHDTNFILPQEQEQWERL